MALMICGVIAVGRDAIADYLWAVRNDAAIYRVDPSTGAATFMWTLAGSPYGGLAFGNGYLWALKNDAKIYRVDPSTGTSTYMWTLPGSPYSGGLAFGSGYLWAVRNDAAIYRVDPSTGAATFMWTLAGSPYGGLAFGNGYLWALKNDAKIYRVDPSTGTSTYMWTLTGSPYEGLAFDNGFLWALRSDASVYRLNTSTGTATYMYSLAGSPYCGLEYQDTTPPSGSVNINSGATLTSSTNVTLTLAATDTGSSVSQMRFSNDGSAWSGWEDYTTTRSWSLAFGDGTKTVYVQFKDGAGSASGSFTDKITLDTTPPSGSVNINSGATLTSSTNVTLTLAAADTGSSVSLMRFSNDDSSWTDWEAYGTNKTWSLTAGDGLKTVFVQFKDLADNASDSYSDTITLDTTAPEMNVQGNSTAIANGDAAPSTTDHTDFGPALVAGGAVVRTYTITNSGNAALKLTGTPMVVVGGAQSNEFAVTEQPMTPVAAGGAETFQITFVPAGVGLRSATLRIDNNDSKKNPYNFSIQGTGVAASLEIDPASMNVTSEASSGLALGVTANVAWTAVSNASWIAVTAGSPGEGNGAVMFSVETNGGTADRTGGVIVAGGEIVRTCTVVQAGAAAQRIIGLSGNLAFGNVMTGRTPTATMTITNTGNAPLKVTDIIYPPGFSGAWSGNIAAGEATNVAVMFSPMEVLIYAGTVTVICDATGGTGSIGISGTGRAGQPEAQDDEGFGVISNQFGFNIGWADGQTVAVDACTNLTTTNWVPMVTNTLTNGTFYFSDPEWADYIGRFYRIRSPP